MNWLQTDSTLLVDWMQPVSLSTTMVAVLKVSRCVRKAGTITDWYCSHERMHAMCLRLRHWQPRRKRIRGALPGEHLASTYRGGAFPSAGRLPRARVLQWTAVFLQQGR